MRLAYLGTSEFAAAVLRRVAISDFKPALVVTPPDRPKGRGRSLSPPPAAITARELGLELHQTPSVNDAGSVEALEAMRIDCAMVCAFGQLIKEPLLSEVEMLNIHPSLLPRWRGAAPIERAIMAGDHETGVAVMRLIAGLDSGPVALRERVAIEPGDEYGSLSARLAELGGELAVKALALHDAGKLEFIDQDEAGATYAEKIEAADRRLDPALPAVELERKVRALTPHIGTFLELDEGERLGIVRAVAKEGERPARGELEASEGRLELGTPEGVLVIEIVKPAGKREMAAADFLHGHPSPRLAA